MKIAMETSSEGHVEMMRKCKPGMRESQLQCIQNDYELLHYNVKNKAYPDIVASGPNSGILHYEINNRIIQSKELVLCDCANRIGNYCADITTTFPSDGKFTALQKYFAKNNIKRDIYELVLSINRKVQSKLKPDVMWMEMEKLCSELLLEGLLKLGIVKGDLKELFSKRVNRLFMPHSLGHLLVFLPIIH